MTTTTRRITVTATLTVAVSTLAACGGAPQATPTRPTVTVTSTQTTDPPPSGGASTTAATTGEPAVGSDDSDASDGSSADECAPDIGFSAAAARDGARITPSSDGGPWRPYNAGGTWCDGLSWVEVEGYSEGGPVRPRQLLIYHDGHFQGTGIRCEARYGQFVLGTTPDTIEVMYTFLDPSNPEQQHHQGGVGKNPVTFRWDGSRVVMDGSLPYAFTKGQC